MARTETQWCLSRPHAAALEGIAINFESPAFNIAGTRRGADSPSIPDLLSAIEAHCGSCSACQDVCPTQAIVAPYRVDARRCISYLTIEHDGPIPLELRPLLGNRIYGCDDCQLACPWNKFAHTAVLADFDARPGLAGASLQGLLGWTEPEFLRRTEGSAIRRIGFQRWQRNLAVAAGNALHAGHAPELRPVLEALLPAATPLVAEHVRWALSTPNAVGALQRRPAIDPSCP